MQLCLAITSLSLSYSEDHKKACEDKKQKYYGDLSHTPGLMNFLLLFIRDIKSEAFSLLVSREVQYFLAENGITMGELPKLPEDQLNAVKQAFKNAPGNRVFRLLKEG
mmetsp:Transcript_48204/g.35389  ORF Transcript_48204/g.35389 Transcript_48204/m.35389 type:complete len:108 (+) Transcript_48204:1037-1360(+)